MLLLHVYTTTRLPDYATNLLGVVESRWAPRSSKPLRGVQTALVGSTPIHSRKGRPSSASCCTGLGRLFMKALDAEAKSETRRFCLPVALRGRNDLYGVDSRRRTTGANASSRTRRAVHADTAPNHADLPRTLSLAGRCHAARGPDQAVAPPAETRFGEKEPTVSVRAPSSRLWSTG
jgi:hypothetical protein